MSSNSTHTAHSISVFPLHDDMYVLIVCIDSMVYVSTECISKSITEYPESTMNFSPYHLSCSHIFTAGSAEQSCVPHKVLWCQHKSLFTSHSAINLQAL